MALICLLLPVVGVLLGIGVARKVEKRPIVIKAEPDAKIWMIIIVIEFIIAFLLVFAEIYVSVLISKKIQLINEIFLLKSFIDNGLLVILFNAIIVLVFFKMIRQNYLDLSGAYSIILFKCVYTIISLSICFDIYLTFRGEDIVEKIVIPHIIAWVVTVTGVWINIDSICQGGINEERQNRERSASTANKVFRKQQAIIIAGILLLLVIYSFLCAYKPSKLYLEYIGAFIVPLLFTMSITVILYMNSLHPSERRSNRILSQKINIMSNSDEDMVIKNVPYLCERYNLQKEGDQYTLSILKRNVIYEFEEEKTKEIMKEKNISFNTLDYDTIRDTLLGVAQERDRFIKQGYDSARNIMEKRKYDNKPDCR